MVDMFEHTFDIRRISRRLGTRRWAGEASHAGYR